MSWTGCAHQDTQRTVRIEAPAPESGPAILLNGQQVDVRWSDGDSFKFKSGPYKGSGVRLMGYNTLESYGPVHRWGRWTATELYEIARSSKYRAAERVWQCTTDGEKDGYGRVLVDCPGVSEHMVSIGHAHVFGMDQEGEESLIRLQQQARRKKLGIWKKGTPESIVTSLHSASEGRGYNRIVSGFTGKSTVRNHDETYAVCQEVCEGGDGGSCMVYVPFKIRYRNKPDCLR
ncbi:MAG: nuclease [Deltaproteobacteria bacterium]|nr:nuclease [Deltaproteobacteria bacterium]